MKIVINCVEKSFEKTEINLGTNGQVSAEERSIYKDIIDNSLWRLKESYILREYLGFVAYQALGINVPRFDIGEHGEDSERQGSFTFLQEYLPGTEKTEITICGEELLSIDLDNALPLIVAIAILGDSDGVGRHGDNVLLEINKVTEAQKKLINIDCGRTFESSRNGLAIAWLNGEEKHPWNSLFDTFVSQHKDNPLFISKANEYLKGLDLEAITKAIKDAFIKFDNIVLKTKCLQKLNLQYERDHHGKEKVGSISFLQNSGIKSIDMLCELLKSEIESLITFFQQQSEPTIDQSSDNSSSPPPGQ